MVAHDGAREDDPAEIRRRRLERLNASMAVAAPAAASPATEPVSPTRGHSRVAPAPPTPPEAAPSPKATLPATGVKRPTTAHDPVVQLDRALRRCLQVTIVDEAKSSSNSIGQTEVMQLRPSDLDGAKELNKVSGPLAVRERARRVSGVDALSTLSGLYKELRNGSRLARSRGDTETSDELLKIGESAMSLGVQLLEDPSLLKHASAGCRSALASALFGRLATNELISAPVIWPPEFVGGLVRGLSDAKIGEVVCLVADVAVSMVNDKTRCDESTVGAVCNGLSCLLSHSKNRAGAALVNHAMFAEPTSFEGSTQPRAAPTLGDILLQSQQQQQQQQQQRSVFEAMAAAVSTAYGMALEQGTAYGLLLRVAGGGAEATNDQLKGEFVSLLRRPDQLESRMRELGQRVSVTRDAMEVFGNAMVKNGPASRQALLNWLGALWARSKTAEASRVDTQRVASLTTRLNALSMLLRLCKPFVGRPEREANARADLAFLDSKMGKALFPAELNKIHFNAEEEEAAAPAPASSGDDSDEEMYAADEEEGEMQRALAMSTDEPVEEEFNFVTILAFQGMRAIRLGLIAEMQRWDEEQHSIHYHASRLGREDPRVQMLFAGSLAKEPAMFHDALLEDALTFSGFVCRWLLRLDEEAFKKTPEHILEDCALLPILIARFRPEALHTTQLTSLLALATRCLSKRSDLVRSPHLRDKFVQAIHACYLPRDAQVDNQRSRPRNTATGADTTTASEANVNLLLNPKEQESYSLAPALLWMFGDAENLGFYDVSPARLRIAALIRQLWGSPLHRAAFRTLASEQTGFITFANGLLNETNRLVASAMERLPLVRDHQARTGVLTSIQGDPQLEHLRREYLAASDQTQATLNERYAEAERLLTYENKLCTETLGLVELLTGDAAVSAAFCLPELRTRLANALMSVMRAFTGARSINIKIENPQKYNFDPRDILTRVGRIATHFAAPNGESSTDHLGAFAEALASSGYFEENVVHKTVATLRRIRTLEDASLDTLDALAGAVQEAAKAIALNDGLTDDAPEHFMDPLLCVLMTKPVKLPSGHVMDLHTIKQHHLNEQSDPFTRQPLSLEDLVPMPELEEEIREWLAAKRLARRAGAL